MRDSGLLVIARKSACPCGSEASYAACCGRWHAGEPAADAQLLMRSRYCAYVLGNIDYLRQTWHPITLPVGLRLDTPQQRRWLGLSICRHIEIDDDHAIVEFVARSRVGGGPAHRMHEISRFVRVAGRWLYVDGDFPETI